MRDAEVAETSVLFRKLKSAVAHVSPELIKSAMGTEKSHQLDHIISDVKEMGSLRSLSPGPLDNSHYLWQKCLNQQANMYLL